MKKTVIVYWSGTGNTLEMAQEILKGAKDAGIEAELKNINEFSVQEIDKYDSFAFGCPSMGDEVLEEMEFEPVFSECESKIKGKQVVLFGSYGWGDGQWMRDWEKRILDDGAELIGSIICCGEPDDEARNECNELGKKL